MSMKKPEFEYAFSDLFVYPMVAKLLDVLKETSKRVEVWDSFSEVWDSLSENSLVSDDISIEESAQDIFKKIHEKYFNYLKKNLPNVISLGRLHFKAKVYNEKHNDKLLTLEERMNVILCIIINFTFRGWLMGDDDVQSQCLEIFSKSHTANLTNLNEYILEEYTNIKKIMLTEVSNYEFKLTLI